MFYFSLGGFINSMQFFYVFGLCNVLQLSHVIFYNVLFLDYNMENHSYDLFIL
jgi:hypothetical protein